MTNPTEAFQCLGLAADCAALAILHYEHVDAHGFDGPGSRPNVRDFYPVYGCAVPRPWTATSDLPSPSRP